MKSENSPEAHACGSADHLSRRTLLRAAGLSGLGWLTPLADSLALQTERLPALRARPRSVIMLWMQGGPSQVDTFDPHPGGKVAYGQKAIDTVVPGLKIGRGLEQTAEIMDEVALVRSVTSREGDHERAVYNVKTGWRPDPTLVHPSLGAVICHELPESPVEIPTHVSILPGPWPARGGYLGGTFDAFKVGDPSQPVPDVAARAPEKRLMRRQAGLSVVEEAFARGRGGEAVESRTLHRELVQRARRMMTSEQLKAFDVSEAPKAEREAYGDSAFGRGCHAAVRLVEAGVRCVEVTLNGWDSHANNREIQLERVATLDPAFAALIRDLRRRGLLETTVVIWGGEFGRTPLLNAIEGRDHWPHAFSVALAGGGIRGGTVIGETDPEGEKKEPVRPVDIADVHSTVQHLFDIDYRHEHMTPVGRPMAFADGRVVPELIR